MKLKSIKNPVLKTMLALTACTSLTTFAGTPAVKSKTVVKPEAAPLFTGSVDVGVDSATTSAAFGSRTTSRGPA